MTFVRRADRWILAASVCLAACAAAGVAEDRPAMRQLPDGGLPKPPSKRALVDAREVFTRRFREWLSHTETILGATHAAENLIAASADENDAALKWLMLDEARELAAAAGRADTVSRAIALLSAFYEFDALGLELDSLADIPLRALDPVRATRLAEAAETLAARAEADKRPDAAHAARRLASRAWQRSGNIEAARRLE